jgi:hypothetical protein
MGGPYMAHGELEMRNIGILKGRGRLNDGRVILKLFLTWYSEGVEWTQLARDRVQWRALVNMVMNFGVSWKVGNFLTGCKLLNKVCTPSSTHCKWDSLIYTQCCFPSIVDKQCKTYEIQIFYTVRPDCPLRFFSALLVFAYLLHLTTLCQLQWLRIDRITLNGDLCTEWEGKLVATLRLYLVKGISRNYFKSE